MLIPDQQLQDFLGARHADPHSWLGMHPARIGHAHAVVVRAFIPGATTCSVVELEKHDTAHMMDKLAPEGFFEAVIKGRRGTFAYQLRATFGDGSRRQFHDPYCFLPTLGESDLYLFNEGSEHRMFTKLGSHVRDLGGVAGVAFAVWAPAAARVSVVGNFNGWDGRFHPMRPLGSSGIWELFIPGIGEGELYKFELRDKAGNILLKTDPYGTAFEGPPNNAAIVCTVDGEFPWTDGAWMERRERERFHDRPLSVYEVHASSWRRLAHENNRPLSYRELAEPLAEHVLGLGFTHVEFLPLAEHPFEASWGYQVTGFFAPTHRLGTPQDFKCLVDHLHARGIGVILDWVPAHFPRDAFALATFDGTHLFEHEDPRQGAHQDWGTLIFNYGRREVLGFLVANALSWLERYHIDGLRVDAVASMLYLDYSRKEGEWIPNRYGGRENLEAIDFLRTVNGTVHRCHPGALMIAEESTAWPGVTKPVEAGGLGFDLKWNMGWMHDTLRFFSKDPIYRKWHYNDLTFGMLYQYAENFITVFSHDEVTHGKASMLFKMGAWHISDKAANLRALYGFQWTWPGKKLLFMGSEFGQPGEWNHAAQLDWRLLQYPDHEGIRLVVRDLNALYRAESALHATDFNPAGFRWVSCSDSANSIISFERLNPATGETILVVGNFTPVERHNYRIGAPRPGFWRELFNSNSAYYGGTGTGNSGGVATDPAGHDNHPQSVRVVLPPMSLTVFKWEHE